MHTSAMRWHSETSVPRWTYRTVQNGKQKDLEAAQSRTRAHTVAGSVHIGWRAPHAFSRTRMGRNVVFVSLGCEPIFRVHRCSGIISRCSRSTLESNRLRSIDSENASPGMWKFGFEYSNSKGRIWNTQDAPIVGRKSKLRTLGSR